MTFVIFIFVNSLLIPGATTPSSSTHNDLPVSDELSWLSMNDTLYVSIWHQGYHHSVVSIAAEHYITRSPTSFLRHFIHLKTPCDDSQTRRDG